MRIVNFLLRPSGLVFLLALLGTVAAAHAQNLLQITSPADGTVMQRGQTISVTFTADPSVSNIALETGFVGGWVGQTSGSGTFSLTIPPTTPIEEYQVNVVGTAGGQLVASAPISVIVDTPLSINTIATMPGTLQFDNVGDVLPLLVIGALSDGSSEFVTYSPQLSFSSSNQNVATVDGRGNVAAVAPGSAFINILGSSTPYNVYVNVAIPTLSSPSFSPPAGTYSIAQTVTLSDATPGGTIYYTTDGTLPTVQSSQYSTPLTVSTTETISALAVASGYSNSEVAIAKYEIVSPTTLSLSSSSNPANYGSQITLTATLSPYSIGGQSTNGESVTFYNGGTSLGTGTLSSGVATFDISSLPAGTDVLTASYGGDAFLSDSVSAAIDETIVAPNYSLTISPGASTVTQGGSVTETVTLSPVGGFQQQITFSCSGLPSYSACSFSPATLTPDGTNAAQRTTVTVSTTRRAPHSMAPTSDTVGGQVIALPLCLHSSCLGYVSCRLRVSRGAVADGSNAPRY
jgi:hypothetical protein